MSSRRPECSVLRLLVHPSLRPRLHESSKAESDEAVTTSDAAVEHMSALVAW